MKEESSAELGLSAWLIFSYLTHGTIATLVGSIAVKATSVVNNIRKRVFCFLLPTFYIRC